MVKRKIVQSEEEEIEDVMAWGSSRANYYKESEDEYSSPSEEEQEVNRIHGHQFEQLNHPDIYELPEPLQEKEFQEEDEEQPESVLSEAYLQKEIKSALKLGLRLGEYEEDERRAHLDKLIQAYLMTLIGMKELKIPHIQHHPIVQKSFQLKEIISSTAKLLRKSSILQQQTQALRDLEKYEQFKRNKDQKKKQLRAISKLQRQKERKSAFLEVGQSEARLASEKILKNKGLIRKRKKIQGNSRVKLRVKYQKKMGMHKATLGHVSRANPGRDYEGETNIKTGRISSVKLK